jgi:hypothetical protein
VVFVGAARGWVVFHPGTRRGPAGIAIPFIVGIPADGDWGPLAVVIPGTVSTRGRNPAVVFIHGGWVRATRWGARPVGVTHGAFLKALDLGIGERRFLRGSSLDAYIGNARDSRALELSLVQFFHGSLQVVGGFELHKPCQMLIEWKGMTFCLNTVTHPLPCSRPVSEYTTSSPDWRAKSFKSYLTNGESRSRKSKVCGESIWREKKKMSMSSPVRYIRNGQWILASKSPQDRIHEVL